MLPVGVSVAAGGFAFAIRPAGRAVRLSAREHDVVRLVAEFATVDPGSFSFRYPVDTQGRPIELAHGYMDLSVLADVIEGVDGYFTGCDGYLDALASAGP